ncbi:MAG: SufS family cysteine desulfurase [Deltaproteobacteria bacterium]|nr:SufS family cysteine desulfurase [Deltaproteobacteria bacterium]
MGLDLQAIRASVPALAQQIHGKPLVYLDNGATALKPQPVIDALLGYYAGYSANVHRGVHTLSVRATEALEAARRDVAAHLCVQDDCEIIFTRGTTESINLVAQTWARRTLVAGDEIVVSAMEHHSNIVPWQLVAAETGAVVRVLPMDDRGVLDLTAAAEIIGDKTRLLAVVAVSNALGTVNPVRKLAAMARAVGAKVLVDGAQAVPHGAVDVHAYDADFFAFSGHKTYGPTGIGVLWGRREALEACGTWHGGGDMIRSVSFEGTTFAELPARLEAGTPHIAGAIGLGAALRWMQSLDLDAIAAHEADLLAYGHALLREIPGLRPIGEAPQKAGVMSFVVDGVHPNDVGTLLDGYGIAVRTGHHCAEPAMRRLGISGTIRASLAVYNTTEDLDRLAEALRRALRLLGA